MTHCLRAALVRVLVLALLVPAAGLQAKEIDLASGRRNLLVVPEEFAEFGRGCQLRRPDMVKELPLERVVVVALGSPYDLLQFPEVAGYLTVYYPVTRSMTSLCDVLLGRRSPTGVLPVNLSDRYPAGYGLGGFAKRKPARDELLNTAGFIVVCPARNRSSWRHTNDQIQ